VPPALSLTREEARAELGWSQTEKIAVLPGAVRSVKLVAEAVAAANQSGWRLALVGEPREPDLVTYARGYGALVCESPADELYRRAVVAADCVLVLRRDSVGETNGPLLDAIGAGRAVLATATGAIPEVAGDAAELCEPDTVSIARGLVALADRGRRAELEALAASRARDLDWSVSARAHRSIFEEAFAC
jgi:glycosyltransferase involved in cell wall biosynthesis